mmetsp:Transcript_32187/g.74892  ORF Transcript_32187/g.74892 Transcript_32187/m.74892 type:complete len:350 (+) Transcript_32187:1293-2342(+)
MQAGARRHLGAVNVDVRAVVRAGADRVHSSLGDCKGAVKRDSHAVKVGDASHLGEVSVVREGNLLHNESLLWAEAREAREGPDVVAPKRVRIPPGAEALWTLALQHKAPKVPFLLMVAVAFGARVPRRRQVHVPVVGVGALVRHNHGRAPPVLEERHPSVVFALRKHHGAAAPAGSVEAAILDEELAVDVDVGPVIRGVANFVASWHVDHYHARKHHPHVVKPPQLVVREHVPKLVVAVESDCKSRLGRLRHELAEVRKVAHLVPAVWIVVGLHAPPVPARALWRLCLARALEADRGDNCVYSRCVGPVVRNLQVGSSPILEKRHQHRVVPARQVAPPALCLPAVKPRP